MFTLTGALRSRAQGEQWKKTTLMTALLYPGVVFGLFFACNLLVWGQKSSGAGAQPYPTMSPFAALRRWALGAPVERARSASASPQRPACAPSVTAALLARWRLKPGAGAHALGQAHISCAGFAGVRSSTACRLCRQQARWQRSRLQGQ